MDDSGPLILFEKDGFTFRRNSKHHYALNLTMINNHIMLDKLVDFGLMKLIYDLNPDIYLTSSIEKLNENEALVKLLLKHFFEDLGLPQKYSYVHMTKKVEENKVSFISKSILSYKPDDIPKDAELLAIENMECVCNIINPHTINYNFEIHFDKNRRIPPLFIQKTFGRIMNKIFNRVKQFIENLR